MVTIAIIGAVAVIAPFFLLQQATALDVLQANQNPSWQHLLGTDPLGRDILLRIIVATRLSLGLAIAAVAVGAAIGIPLGAVTAILSRRVRPVALRTIDTLLAFPAIIVAIFVGAIFGRGATGATVGVGIAISFAFARVASTLALSIGAREYVVAARVVGVKGRRLFLRYILPNIAETMIIQTSVAISSSIVFMSALSFLGLGVQPPAFDWGRMLTEGVQAFYITPAAAIGPAVAIATSALALGFAGEAMARAMNPLLWSQNVQAAAERASESEQEVELTRAAQPELEAAAMRALSAAVNDNRPAPIPGQNRHLALEVRDLSVTFPGARGPIEVVAGVSFDLPKGEMLGIVGESGSGKTMTAMAIAQLVPYPGLVSGIVKLAGQDLSELSPRRMARFLSTDLAVVFQDPMSSLNPALKIGTQLTEAPEVHRGLTHRQSTQLAVASLRELNIPTPELQMERHPHEFSGGMRQRAMIAMGLMNDPDVLIADEPTTALDVTIQAQIMDLLAEINTTHEAAIIFISHNLALVRQNCHNLLVMYAGRIVEDIPSDRLLIDPLHPYTRALLTSVPDMELPRDRPLPVIPGTAPDMANLPDGCPYNPRCPLAVDKCRKVRPPLVTRPDGRRVACWVANEDTD
jgi:oligopeptide/dipeptide ABC transporter ATP-binding protein